jgi:DNA invertase Pin-like site-specific DNA recombinase
MSRISKFSAATAAASQLPLDQRVVFYIRASTLEQVNSLDAQKLAGQRWAEAKGFEVVHIFTDAGVSAVKHGIRDRPQARRMFATMARENIRRAIFIRPIRAFRSTLDFVTTSQWMTEQGIVFSFTDPEIDSGTMAGKLMLQLLVSVGEMECETRAAAQNETYDSLRDRRVARTNHASYGWENAEASGQRSRKSGNELATQRPIPAEQAVLRHILQLWEMNPAHGALTRIATTLNDLGIPTKMAGQPMTKHGITRICSGTWQAATVKSVLAHALLATDAELLDGIPTLEQAAAQLAARHSSRSGAPVSTGPSFIHSSSSTFDF